MIHYTTAALLGCLLLGVYYTAMALIGAMAAPAPGEERTRYAFWYRVAQLLAANIQRAAEHRFGPDFAAATHLERTVATSAAGGAAVTAVHEQTDVLAATASAGDGQQ